MAERGQDYILQGSDDGGTTWTPIGKLTSITLNRGRDTTETNNFDSPDDAESIATMRNWGISGGALYVYDDPGQEIVESARELSGAEDPYQWRLTPVDQTRTGVYQFTGSGHVTDATIEFETNEVVAYNLEVEGTGGLTRATIA